VLSNFGGQAVLNRETGLVWEKSPSAAVGFTWDNAVFRAWMRSEEVFEEVLERRR